MSEIDDLVASVNKKYKTNIVRKASELKSVEFIPYTSPKMNYLTRGGVAGGRMIELVGLQLWTLSLISRKSILINTVCIWMLRIP